MKNKLKKIKQKKMIVFMIALVVLTAAAVIFLRIKGRKNTEGTSDVSVQSATVSKDTIANTIESSGTLSIGETTQITVPSGLKVQEVYVETGDSVTAGQELASVTSSSVAAVMLDINEKIDDTEDAIDDLSDDADDTSSDEYLKKVVLEGCLEELNSWKSTLETIQSEGVIKASCDGVITAVNVSEGSGTESTSTNSGASNMSSTSDYTLMTLTTDDTTSRMVTSSTTEAPTASDILTVVNAAGDSGISLTSESRGDEDQNSESSETEGTDGSSAAEGTDDSSAAIITKNDLSALSITVPKAGEKPQSKIAEGSAYTGTISWDPAGTFEAGKTYTASVILTAKAGFAFSTSADYSLTIADADPSTITPTILGGDNVEGNSLQIQAVFKTEESKSTSGSGNNASSNNENTFSGNNGSMGGMTYYSGSISGSSGSSASSESSGFDTSDYEISTASAFSVTSGDEVHITVDVDELDINSVENGQSAQISLDALEGQTFEGTITKVSDTTSSSNGGNAKYAVEITLDKADGMKSGMSASAVINIEEAEDALVVPVNALQESGDRTFVYTSQEADGTLSGEVDVEVGLSNGSQVEIISGLSEGDTVYYTKIASDNDSMEMSAFPGGMMQDGDKPDNMPEGGMSSGGGPDGSGNGGGPQRGGN